MAFVCGSGIAETTTTTGTGSYALGGAVSGYLAFSSAVALSDTTFYRCDNGSGTWEVGIGTRSGSATLTRDTILKTSSGGTSAINWGAGTKTITCVYPGESVVAKNRSNTFTADQYFNAKKLYLNAAGDSWIVGGVSTGTEYIDVIVDGEWIGRWTTAGLRIVSDNADANAEPQLILDRNSASPADDDVIGKVYFRGRDSGDNSCDYATIRGEAADVTDATEDGRLVITTKVAGNDVDSLTLDGATLFCEDATSLFLMGKTASSGATAGVELEGSGILRVTRSGANMATFNRLASTGQVMTFQYANATKGTISVDASATTYATTSDERLKSDIADYRDGLDVVRALRPVEYAWIDEPGSPREVGLIAQEVREVVPRAVSGSVQWDPLNPLSVDYGRLTPWLIGAVQTLADRCDRLSAEVERLKNGASE